MLYGLLARIRAGVATVIDDVRGQGTVEYVALILLVAIVLAGVVAAVRATDLGGGDIGKAILDKIKAAMNEVS